MGLDERIPLNREPVESLGPQEVGRYAHASQPPLGCRYYDNSSNMVTVAHNTTTTLDFRSGGVQYDPYDMISVADDTVRIPQPGVWDLAFEVIADGATTASGDFYFAQFAQGTAAANGLADNQGQAWCAGSGLHALVRCGQSTYLPQSTLGAGDLFRLRAYQFNGATTNRSMKIVSFSLWLRSAHVPSKY